MPSSRSFQPPSWLVVAARLFWACSAIVVAVQTWAMLGIGVGSPVEAWIWRGGIAFLAAFMPALLLGHFSTPHGAASCPQPLRWFLILGMHAAYGFQAAGDLAHHGAGQPGIRGGALAVFAACGTVLLATVARRPAVEESPRVAADA